MTCRVQIPISRIQSMGQSDSGFKYRLGLLQPVTLGRRSTLLWLPLPGVSWQLCLLHRTDVGMRELCVRGLAQGLTPSIR